MVWKSLRGEFRRWFARRSKISETAPSLAEMIGPEESFTRFIFSKKHFASNDGRVKAQALLPRFNEAKARFETSVHRTDGLPDQTLWELGYAHVENASAGRIIKARGFGAIRVVREFGLDTDVNGPPFPRHVDLVGWSPSPDDKHSRLMCAMEIVDKMQLQLDPRSRGDS